MATHSQVPNQMLARKICETKNKSHITLLVENLQNKKLQSDCIKVLYEIGAINPELIKEYDGEFIKLISGNSNRMKWGAMMALDYIASVNPVGIYNSLPAILRAADKGSVITKDHCINILIKLCAHKRYADAAFTILLDSLKTAFINQLPKYAEDAAKVMNDKYKAKFREILISRLDDFENGPKLKRLEKVINKLHK